jgi:hypothetical protein
MLKSVEELLLCLEIVSHWVSLASASYIVFDGVLFTFRRRGCSFFMGFRTIIAIGDDLLRTGVILVEWSDAKQENGICEWLSKSSSLSLDSPCD